MKLRKMFYRAQASQPHISRLLTLCAFFAAGILSGQLLQHVVPGGDLADYLRHYAGLIAQGGTIQTSLPRIAAAYLREPLVIIVLGFCTFGAVAIPLVCVWQGFTLSFAVACFAGSLGYDGLLLALAAFGVRSVIVLPCTLLIAQWAFDKALHRLRSDTAAHSALPGQYRRLTVCLTMLLVGAVLEMTLVPKLFALVLSRVT